MFNESQEGIGMIDMHKALQDERIPPRDEWKVYKTHLEPIRIFQDASKLIAVTRYGRQASIH